MWGIAESDTGHQNLLTARLAGVENGHWLGMWQSMQCNFRYGAAEAAGSNRVVECRRDATHFE